MKLAVFAVFLLGLVACAKDDEKVQRVPLLRTSTAKTPSLDTTNADLLSGYFDFKVEPLNFDFYPSDITCELQGATFEPAGELTAQKVGDEDKSLIGTFLVAEELSDPRFSCSDKASREIDLLVARLTPQRWALVHL